MSKKLQFLVYDDDGVLEGTIQEFADADTIPCVNERVAFKGHPYQYLVTGILLVYSLNRHGETVDTTKVNLMRLGKIDVDE